MRRLAPESGTLFFHCHLFLVCISSRWSRDPGASHYAHVSSQVSRYIFFHHRAGISSFLRSHLAVYSFIRGGPVWPNDNLKVSQLSTLTTPLTMLQLCREQIFSILLFSTLDIKRFQPRLMSKALEKLVNVHYHKYTSQILRRRPPISNTSAFSSQCLHNQLDRPMGHLER